MKSIIEKLYYGEICPCESPLPNTERFRENRNTICNTEEKLLEQFPKCKELLSEYADARRIEAQLASEADFVRGFRLGATLILDIIEIQK